MDSGRRVPNDPFLKQVAYGERIATRSTMDGTHLGDYSGVAATGRVMERTGITIKRFDSGKVAESGACAGLLPAFRQMGVVAGNTEPAG